MRSRLSNASGVKPSKVVKRNGSVPEAQAYGRQYLGKAAGAPEADLAVIRRIVQ